MLIRKSTGLDDWNLLIGPEARDDTRRLGDYLRVRGFYNTLNIPTKGDGKPLNAPTITTSGKEIAAINMSDFQFIFDTQNIERNHVLEFAGMIHGDVGDGLHMPTKRVQKTLDPEASGNQGNDALIAVLLLQHRIRSDMVMAIIREVYDHAALESLDAYKDLFTWTREDDGTEFYDGITCLWLILEMINPKTVIDATELEKTLTNSKLLGPPLNGDVRAYFSLMKRTRDELCKRHGKERFSEQRFLQTIFDQLLTIGQPVFKQYIQGKYTGWTENLASFDMNATFTGIDNVYASLCTSGKWEPEPKEDPKVIALATENKKLQKQVRAIEKRNAEGKNDSSNGSNDSTDDKWREVYSSPRIKAPSGKDKGQPFFWCKDHNHGKGMYMPDNSVKNEASGHYHDRWKAKKEKFGKKRNGKKRKGDDSSTSSTTSSTPKLLVDRSSKKSKKEKQVQFLVTERNMDHVAATEMVNQLQDYSSDEESKA